VLAIVAALLAGATPWEAARQLGLRLHQVLGAMRGLQQRDSLPAPAAGDAACSGGSSMAVPALPPVPSPAADSRGRRNGPWRDVTDADRAVIASGLADALTLWELAEALGLSIGQVRDAAGKR
jgi:hypothetical protein